MQARVREGDPVGGRAGALKRRPGKGAGRRASCVRAHDRASEDSEAASGKGSRSAGGGRKSAQFHPRRALLCDFPELFGKMTHRPHTATRRLCIFPDMVRNFALCRRWMVQLCDVAGSPSPVSGAPGRPISRSRRFTFAWYSSRSQTRSRGSRDGSRSAPADAHQSRRTGPTPNADLPRHDRWRGRFLRLPRVPAGRVSRDGRSGELSSATADSSNYRGRRPLRLSDSWPEAGSASRPVCRARNAQASAAWSAGSIAVPAADRSR